MSVLNFLLFISSSVCVVSSTTEVQTLVQAPAGSFQGLVDSDPNGQKYVAFRGIPYAKPPIGELRFAKPQPLDKIDGIFDATKGGNVCPIPKVYEQMIGAEQGKEDCLLLNVYAKEINSKKLKKVMLFIHGGGYLVGNGKEMLAGNFVTSHDVVFVTINYRLGLLGFMSTGDDVLPGNYGLWDMTMALQWVKDNIASFGGDPSDVAISGESAGASAVGYLSISPYTNGLFTKAFPQSGGPSATFGKFMTPLKSTLKIGKAMNCYEGDLSDQVDQQTKQKIINCLRSVPAENFTDFGSFSLDNVEFVPTVDGDFIPRPPLHLLHDDEYLKSVGFFKRSYLVGIDNNENSIFTTHRDIMLGFIRQQEGMSAEQKEDVINNLMEASKAFYLSSRLDTEAPKSVIDKVADFYDRRFGDGFWGQMVGDLGFLVPSYDFLEAVVRGKESNAWLFHFNHYPRFMQGQHKGIIHGLDLAYWFDFSLEQCEKMLKGGIDTEMGMSSEDVELRTQFSNMIAVFTKTGSPPESVDGVSWPKYTSKNKEYLDFKPRMEVREDLGYEVRRLWLEDVPRWMEEERQRKQNQHTEL